MFTGEILGGFLIGLASAIPLVFEGRIAGVSGYASAALRPSTGESKTALLFVWGLVLGGFVWKVLGYSVPTTPELSLYIWALAGLLVGFGSRLGGGCTSGHGVCGLGRLSKRSLVSVVCFMAAAVATRLTWGLFS